MDIITTNKNLSMIFLLPMLYDKLDKQSITYINKYITNSYIKIKDNPTKVGLILLFDNINSTVAATLYIILKPYTTWFDYTHKKAIFSLISGISTTEWYKLFIQGKYSKFEAYNKLLIIKYWQLDDTSDVWSILFKTFKFRHLWSTKFDISKWSEDAEYWHKPIILEETLT